MDNQVKEILNDLYAYDPGFKVHEAELVKIITELIRLKPDTKFDQEFANILKKQLMAKASLMPQPKTQFMKNLFKYFVPAALVVALVVFARNYYQPGSETTQELFSADQQVEYLGEEAFGKLALNQAGGAGGGGGLGMGGDLSRSATPAPMAVVPTQGESEPAVAQDPANKARPQSGGGSDAMIYPYYNYRYVYKGDDLTLENGNAAVYKRVKNSLNASAVSNALNKMNFGLFDLKSFGSTQIQSINLLEDRDFGYNFYVDFMEGRISINENWQKWMTPDRQCTTPECYESFRLKPSDIPADGEMINLAKQFLADHKIALNNYGEPFVQNYWQREYEMAADKSQIYIPDAVSVVFPLKVEDQEVYDEGGNKTGLMVNVNVRVKRVSGVYELAAQNFQASSYKSETDFKKLVGLAEQGGFRGGVMPFAGEQGQTVDVELGTPKLALVKYWNYKDNQSEELLIPSLIFPITKQPTSAYYYPQNIVIPLVLEVLEQAGGPIQIMK